MVQFSPPPPSLVDLLDTPEEQQEENEEEAGVYDYEELLDYLDDDDKFIYIYYAEMGHFSIFSLEMSSNVKNDDLV